MYSPFFIIKTAVFAIHTDWKFVPYFADDGSLDCVINNRFGHNCTFKIPEYNIYMFIARILERFLK